MGILNLSKLIGDYAPLAVKENEMKNYFGRKIAIDASMSIYQFLIAVRQDGNTLTNADGETTSHLMGIFYRTIRMMKHGIKPVYVFDGKPPQMKSGELAKRQERRDDAQKSLQKAEEDGDLESVNKFSRRLVKVTKQHSEECRQLLTLMGVPHIEAPCEAEAQCAELVKGGKVYAVATEDMDGLTFGAQILLRHMTFSESRKMPIKEFHLERLLSELQLTKVQFIDLCILLGCDYCESIRGVGPKRALELIREFGNMEAIIKRLNETKKFVVPEQWPYEEARRLFTDPDVTPANEIVLKWSEPDIEALVKFMCVDNGFSEERIRNGADKLFSAKKSQTQGRLDTFFKVIPNPAAVSKRKSEETSAAAKKKSKSSSARGRKPK